MDRVLWAGAGGFIGAALRVALGSVSLQLVLGLAAVWAGAAIVRAAWG